MQTWNDGELEMSLIRISNVSINIYQNIFGQSCIEILHQNGQIHEKKGKS